MTIGQTIFFSCFRKYSFVVAFLMICSMRVDQERVESMCTPSNLYVVTLSTVCDAVLARRPRTICVVLQAFVSIPLWARSCSLSSRPWQLEHSNSVKKSFDSIRFSLPNRFFRFHSIRQSDKFAASTLIIVKKLNSLKHLVRTTVAESHN